MQRASSFRAVKKIIGSIRAAVKQKCVATTFLFESPVQGKRWGGDEKRVVFMIPAGNNSDSDANG